jgi:GMP synthase-like glutamine amidotransferase
VIRDEYPSNPFEFNIIFSLSLIFLGAKYSSYETDEWITTLKKYVTLVVERKLSFVFAVCFGQQIIAEALGGRTIKNCRGWEAGSYELTHSLLL